MLILVCGSRDWRYQDTIADVLSDYAVEDTTIMHGACSRKVKGVEVSADMLADRVARIYGYKVRQYPADWKSEPRRAGFIRNLQMLDLKPDLVIAFQRNNSHGTQHTIDNAKKRNIPVRVISEN